VTGLEDSEEKSLPSVALQNARAVLHARQRAERDLILSKEALELKSAELSEQREFFRVTFSSIGDAVITTDTEVRITFLNPVAEAMTGSAQQLSEMREPVRWSACAFLYSVDAEAELPVLGH
jgi:PAS domain-containing protein